MHVDIFKTAESYQQFILDFGNTINVISVIGFNDEIILTYEQ